MHAYISGRSIRSAAFCACAHLSKVHEGSQCGNLECRSRAYSWNIPKKRFALCNIQSYFSILPYLDDGVKAPLLHWQRVWQGYSTNVWWIKVTFLIITTSPHQNSLTRNTYWNGLSCRCLRYMYITISRIYNMHPTSITNAWLTQLFPKLYSNSN